MTAVPLTHGEEWGLKWDFNRLVENHDVDFIRSTLPNAGGITEMMKIAAMCETHAVGIIPHFTGPVATASGAAALGHPAAAVAWLVRSLAVENEGLRAGDVVLSGGLRDEESTLRAFEQTGAAAARAGSALND